MTTLPHNDPGRRHDFILLFDVQNGNPNGDPDAGNAPRTDPETMHGVVTDVSIKRRVRDYVDAARGHESRYKIYVQRETYLTETRTRVFEENKEKAENPTPHQASHWLCQQFYDIRMFGAVMSMTESNAGQVRGPMQMTFANSIDPILPIDSTIARVAHENRRERQGDSGSNRDAPSHGTLGRKYTVPYALYRSHGFFNPHFARHTGADPEDLDIFWHALINMWDLDRSSSRGLMSCRGLYVFSHEHPLGNAPAQRLFDRMTIQRKDDAAAPRQFDDYLVSVNEDKLPKGVTVARLDV